MSLSLVYLALRLVLQLLLLSLRSEEFKELEIVVLRHELAVVPGRLRDLPSSLLTGRSWLRRVGSFRGHAGGRSS